MNVYDFNVVEAIVGIFGHMFIGFVFAGIYDLVTDFLKGGE